MWWIPNLLTYSRIALTPFVAISILSQDCGRALLLSLIAGASDAADGFLARRFGWVTRSGAYLDPIADKFLLTTVYVCLGMAGLIPLALVGLVVGRDVVILVLAAAGMLLTSIREFPPSIWGKLSTCIQIGTALVVLSACSGLPVTQGAQKLAIAAAFGATAWSGVHYLWRAYCLARRERRRVGQARSNV